MCTDDTKVTAKFVFGDATDTNTLSNGLTVKLRVDGWPGARGFIYNASRFTPLSIDMNAMLSASGKVTEGVFRTIGVIKLSYD
jgi:hypothetical protein